MSENAHRKSAVPAKILSKDESVILAAGPSRRYNYTLAAVSSVLLFVVFGLSPLVLWRSHGPGPTAAPKAVLAAPQPASLPAALGPDILGGAKVGLEKLVAFVLDSHLLTILALIAALGLWVSILLRLRFNMYVLTDQRLIRRVGAVMVETRYMPLARIQNLEVTQTLVQRMLGCGDIKISSAGFGHQDMVWVCVDSPYEVVEQVRQRVDQPADGVAAAASAARSGDDIPSARPADANLKAALNGLKIQINRFHEEGYCEWSRQTVQRYWKGEVPITDEQVQQVLRKWEQAGMIKLVGREDCYFTVLRPFPTKAPGR